MNADTGISKILYGLNPELAEAIRENAEVKYIPRDTEILRQGQYIKSIPVVVSGLVKVFINAEDKELLLYYLKPAESCIMSFAACLQNEPGKIFALTEEDTEVLLLPAAKVLLWVKEYPDINSLFLQQYSMRYEELLNTIQHLLFSKLDQRLYDFLQKRSAVMQMNPVKISHRKIAAELGTSREVITRLMKKLEAEGKAEQQGSSIKILPQ